MGLYIGIDLGTTNVSCHVVDSTDGTNQCKILPIRQLVSYGDGFSMGEENYLPSVVFFFQGQAYIGVGVEENLERLLSIPNSSLASSVKDSIGDDHWRCTVNDLQAKEKSHSSVEVMALLLRTVWKSVAKAYKLDDIENITITIPAKFSSKMRYNTLLSAKMANLPMQKVALLDEPIAALFSDWDGSRKTFASIHDAETVMVYDIGGGTVDACIIEVNTDGKRIDLLSTSRFNHLGGRDWDLEIAALLLRKIKRDETYNGFFESADRQLRRSRALRLMKLAKHLKETLDELLLERKVLKKDGALREDLLSFLAGHKAELSQPFEVGFSEFEGLLPEIIIVTIDELLHSFAHLLDFKHAKSQTNFFTPVFQALELTEKDLDIRDIDKIFITGGASQSRLVSNQIEYNHCPRTVSLDPKLSISRGASWFSSLFSNGIDQPEWKLGEKTTEKLFLAVSGKGFVEILNSGLSIPSGEVEVLLLEERIALRQIAAYDSQRKKYQLSIYQGISREDPLVRPFVDVEFKEFNKLNIYNDITVSSVKGIINSNRIYTFTINFTDSEGKNEFRRFEFDIDTSFRSVNRSGHNAKIKLNNLDILNQKLN